MRTIMVGGVPCPIKATTGTISAGTARLSAVLQDAEERVTDHWKDANIHPDDLAREMQQERRRAQQHYMSDARHSLETISDMLNAAVDSERILHGHDIREQCPYYPVTPEKLGMVMTLSELNSMDTAKTIADEIAEATGSKNLTAGQLVQVAQMIL